MIDNNGYFDLSNMSISIDGHKVYKFGKLRINKICGGNWLLKKLFKIVHIEIFDVGQSITIYPKYGEKSCRLWNLLGNKYFINSNGLSLKGTMKFDDYSKSAYRIFKTKVMRKDEQC